MERNKKHEQSYNTLSKENPSKQATDLRELKPRFHNTFTEVNLFKTSRISSNAGS